MKKIYALLAAVCLAAELALIEFAVPLYGQIVICTVFVVFLFYFVLTSEKLIDRAPANSGRGREVIYVPQSQITRGKKGKKRVVVKRVVVEPEPVVSVKRKKPKEDEEKESEFLSEWHRMERAAEKL